MAREIGVRGVLNPTVDDRQLDQEVNKLAEKFDAAAHIEPEVEDTGGFGSGGAAPRGGGGGGAAGGLLGGVASGSGLMKVALGGAVGVGLLKGIQAIAGSSAAFQQVASKFDTAMDLFFRPFGNKMAEWFNPLADDVLTMAEKFNKIASEEGLAVAVQKIAGDLLEGVGETALETVGLDEVVDSTPIEQLVGGSSLVALIGGTIGAGSFLTSLIGSKIGASSFLSLLGLGGGAAGAGAGGAGAGATGSAASSAAGAASGAAGSAAKSSGGGLIGGRSAGAALGITGATLTAGNIAVGEMQGRDLLDMYGGVKNAATGGEEERQAFQEDFTEDFATSDSLVESLGLRDDIDSRFGTGTTSSLLQGQSQMGAATLEAFGGDVGEGAVAQFNAENPDATITGEGIPEFQERSTLPTGVESLPNNSLLGDAAGEGVGPVDESKLRERPDSSGGGGTEGDDELVSETQQLRAEVERMRQELENMDQNMTVDEQSLKRSVDSAENTYGDRTSRSE